MSFAFGLAVLGSALAVTLRAHLAASASEQRDIIDRITLESAVNGTLGRLAAGEVQPIQPTALDDVLLNGRRIAVELSLPEGKRDLGADPDASVLEILERHGLARPAGGQLAPSSFGSITEFSRAWRFSSSQEDCLRRVATVGRAPERFKPEARPGDEGHLVRTITPGDQVDLRVSYTTQSSTRVLWVRARFTGARDFAWRFHDYKPLTLGSAPHLCAKSIAP